MECGTKKAHNLPIGEPPKEMSGLKPVSLKISQFQVTTMEMVSQELLSGDLLTDTGTSKDLEPLTGDVLLVMLPFNAE